MNRRSFFKFLGIGAATAALAPKVLLSESVPIRKKRKYIRRLDAILPDEVKISDEDWKFLKYLEYKLEQQLGVNEMKLSLRKPIQRIKRNA